MSVTRLIGILVVIIVIYMVVTQPVGSANMTRDGVSRLGDAGSQVIAFVSNVVRGTAGSGSGSSYDRTTPIGGAGTGDGSSQIR